SVQSPWGIRTLEPSARTGFFQTAPAGMNKTIKSTVSSTTTKGYAENTRPCQTLRTTTCAPASHRTAIAVLPGSYWVHGSTDFRDAERCASGAPGSGSDAGADAGGRRLDAMVRRGVLMAGSSDVHAFVRA